MDKMYRFPKQYNEQVCTFYPGRNNSNTSNLKFSQNAVVPFLIKKFNYNFTLIYNWWN